MEVPFVDLKAQYLAIKPEIDEAVYSAIEDTAFIQGDRVRDFESAFADYCGAAHAIACSSGTTALHIALLAAGVKPGDEVIVPSHTFIATAEAVCHCGAVPVFADIDAASYTMDPSRTESLITPKTRALVPVHLYGQLADMDAFAALAEKHGLALIEDTAQAHGAELRGRRAGALAPLAAFSFYPGKNLGAYGDGGAVTAADPETASWIAKMVNHGRTKKYEHELVGYNYRMDALQAAILTVKLNHLAEWTARRKALARRYDEMLADAPVTPPAAVRDHVYHLYVIRTKDRDGLRAHLKEKGIASGIHYPIPLHLQPCFQGLETAPLPVTEQAARDVLSLPLFPEMSEEQQDYIVQAIRAFTAGRT